MNLSDSKQHDGLILLVDDNIHFRAELRGWLEAAGYEVAEACNGKEAFALLQAESIKAVVTDIVMPDVDGIELIMMLKRKKRDIPIIAMSGGNMGFSDLYLGITGKLGASASLNKPFTNDQLLDHLRSLAIRPGKTTPA